MDKPVTSRSDPDSRRAYTRWHYQQNKALYKARAKAKTIETREAVRTFVYEYLLSHPCIDCGETDPIVLEFDHRETCEKLFELGSAMQRGYGIKSVKSEIAKCDVRCSNCHRRVTYHRAGRTHRSPPSKN